MLRKEKERGGKMNTKKLIIVFMALVVGFFGVVQPSFAISSFAQLGQGGAAEDKNTQEKVDEASGVTPKKKGGLGKVKGSPMHGWKAFASKKKQGDILTLGEFRAMRNWSPRTIGYELQSLVAIGVLRALGNGRYEVLVDATEQQIDAIDDAAIPLVNRTGIHGEALGIDSYRLDATYLGRGDVQAGETILEGIRAAVAETTGTEVQAPAELSADFVAEQEATSALLPASVLINEDAISGRDFTIHGENLEAYNGITSETDTRRLLGTLVDLRLVSSTATRTGEAYDVSPSEVRPVFFQEGYVLEDFKRFGNQVKALDENQIAVIVSTNADNAVDIENGLYECEAELSDLIGDRIMIVDANETAALAYARLFNQFGPNGFFDLDDMKLKTTDDILNDRDLVAGLEGSV